MVVLEDEAGDAKPMSTEETEKNESKSSPLLSLEIFRITKDAQQQHGLRHGDYQRYRGYCSRRIRRLRKVLKIPQGDRRHYRRRDVTSVHLSASTAESRLLCVPLLQAERAWAHAMQLRQEANTEPRKKFHLVSRLKKAVSHAQTLLQLCEQTGICDARTQLEAGAYASWLEGVLLVERQQWRAAAERLQRAHLVLRNLSAALPADERQVYTQKSEELKPSLRYCAYNIGDESAAGDLVAMRSQGLIDNLDSLMAQAKESRSGVMHEVEWRGRTVTVRPEKVRLFLIALQDFDKSASQAPSAQAKIDIIENILMDCKDAISAIKDEIKNDPKLKSASAQETQLSGINYLLSYLLYLRLVRTIERNNLLVQQAEEARKNNAQIDGKKVRPHDLTRLYEIILQNFTELQQLPGFESDAEYQKEIETQMTAYRAFRCFYIAQVLTGLRRFREALAMLERSNNYTKESLKSKIEDKQLLDKLQVLKKDIESCKFEVHADSVLEDDDEQDEDSKFSGKYKDKKPLVERLDEYREDSQILTKNPNVYKMPPSMEAIPCKPLFFDLACNFVEFPNLADKTGAADGKKPGAGLTGLVKGFLGWGKSDK